jgi:sulfite dehydrogenase
LSAHGGRRRGATAAAEAGIALAMLFLMFVSALVGFGIGRHTGDGGTDNVAAVSTTQNGEETVTTSGGAGGEGATSAETTTSAPAETSARETTTGGGGGGNTLAAGKTVFESAGCGGCHTLKAAGSTGNIGPNLDEAKPSLDKAIERVTNGKGPMPPFKGQLSDAQIKAVAQFVSSSTRG